MDLADSLGHINAENAQFNQAKNGELNIKVPAFGVSYGMQNQQYFKGININMDSPITTDYSIANTLQLSQTGAKGDKNFPMGIGQNIYSIYSNRSYSVTVEMMGCANIMPMMYFQLNNIPMFKGAYMIVSVSHSIKAGTMTTTFTGIRQSKYLYPLVSSNIILTDILDRFNKNGGSVSSVQGGSITFEPVPGKAFADGIELYNVLDGSYSWKPNNGSAYPYRRRTAKPKYIILHYTGGPSSASGMAKKLIAPWVKLWNSGSGGGSADFGVDDGGMYQFVPNIQEWHATWCNGGTYDADGKGGRSQHDNQHLDGIGIEMCSKLSSGSYEIPNHNGWSFTEQVLTNTAILCANLIMTFKSTMPCSSRKDVDRIISTHYLVSGKICPGIKGWNKAQMNEQYVAGRDEKGRAIPAPIPGVFNDMEGFDKFKDLVWEKLQGLRGSK